MAKGGGSFGRKGFTIVEVVIAILLVGVMAMAFGLAMTAKTAGVQVDCRTQASAAIRNVSDALKSYVTADATLTSPVGPGNNAASCSNKWHLPGDTNVNCALTNSGTHVPPTSLLGVFATAPCNGTLTYTMTTLTPTGGDQQKVTFVASW
jgi:prepilin-type N-terminal cleavage/methylation domain-containing protein